MLFKKNSELRELQGFVFYNCTELKRISLPDGLESIGYGCFNNSGLEEIAIPESVRQIEGGYEDGQCYGLFSKCPNL